MKARQFVGEYEKERRIDTRSTALAEPGVRALLILFADLDSVIRHYDGVPLPKRYGLIVDAWGAATEALDPSFSFAEFKAARRRVREGK